MSLFSGAIGAITGRNSTKEIYKKPLRYYFGAAFFILIFYSIRICSKIKKFLKNLQTNDRALTHFWGGMLLVGVFYFRNDRGVAISHAKNMLFLFTSFGSAIIFGIKDVSLRLRILIAVILSLSFFNMWNVGSFVGIFKFVNISAGAILYIQAKRFNFNTVKRYVALIGTLAGASILLGYLKIDYYDIVTNTYYMSGGKLQRKTEWVQNFHGLLNGVGHTGLLAALGTVIGGWFSILIGILATLKIASIGTVTPFLALSGGLGWRVITSKGLRCREILICWILITGGLAYQANNQDINNVVKREVKQMDESIRWKLWKEVWRASEQDKFKWKGRGLGFFHDAMRHKERALGARGVKFIPWNTPHNSFLGVKYAFGYIGLGLFLMVLIRALVISFGSVYSGGVIVFIISACTWFPLHVEILGPIAIIILSISNERGVRNA